MAFEKAIAKIPAASEYVVSKLQEPKSGPVDPPVPWGLIFEYVLIGAAALIAAVVFVILISKLIISRRKKKKRKKTKKEATQNDA